MTLLFYVIKIKQVLFWKTHVLCLLSNFLLHEMSHKKKALFQKDMLEKRCAVVKSYWWHMEKNYYLLRNYHVTQPKISC